MAAISSAQTRRVRFEKDVLPILRQNCIGCHGPSQLNSGFRLDRRSSARSDFRGIVPGSSSTSRLYLRLTGNQFGMQMPPTGPLNTSQLATIRDWIDQGAEWPDSLANEVDRPTANPMAVSLVALETAGVNNAAIGRGVQFLLDSQGGDGTWHARSRALAFQPYFESGFPYRYDQWISAAGTS